MKKKIWIIVIIGCICLICISVVAFLILGITTIGKNIEEEFSTLNIVPTAISLKESNTSPQPSLENQIAGLSYIKVSTVGFTDDADPEYEGIALDIDFYNEKSESINFASNPIKVQIELYGYRDIMDTFDITKSEKVYQGTVEIDHSMKLGEMFGNYIRIPYEEINVDQSDFVEFGTTVVTIETPSGIFSDTEDLVSLYPLNN